MTRLTGNGEIEEASSVTQGAGMSEPRRPRLLQVIWHRRWILLLVTVASLGGGVAYLTQATPIFRSALRLYVEQRGPRILSDERGVMAESKNYLHTQAELLRSTPILAAALEAPSVREAQTFADADNPLRS